MDIRSNWMPKNREKLGMGGLGQAKKKQEVV
jgi:hypothetical protein